MVIVIVIYLVQFFFISNIIKASGSHRNRSNSLCSSVDDIVLSYIVNVLEQIGEDEEFGVDDFAEIMAAYIPGFDTVSRYLYLTHLWAYSIIINDNNNNNDNHNDNNNNH